MTSGGASRRGNATLTAHAQLLSEHGARTADATKALIAAAGELHVQHDVLDEVVELLDRELASWADDEGARVVAAVATHVRADRPLDPSELLRWLRHHHGEADKVADCLDVVRRAGFRGDRVCWVPDLQEEEIKR